MAGQRSRQSASSARRRARAGRLAVWGSGKLETWKTGALAAAATERQLARFSDSQVPRTPATLPGSVGAPRGSVAAAETAFRNSLTRFGFPPRGSVAPAARFGFGSVGLAASR